MTYHPVLGEMRFDDRFGQTAALQTIEPHIDDEAERLRIATALADFVDSKIDYTDKEKDWHYSEACPVIVAFATAAAIAPASDIAIQTRLAENAHEILDMILTLPKESYGMDPIDRFFAGVEDTTASFHKMNFDKFFHHDNKASKDFNEMAETNSVWVGDFYVMPDDMAQQLDDNLEQTPTWAILKIYQQEEFWHTTKVKQSAEFVKTYKQDHVIS